MRISGWKLFSDSISATICRLSSQFRKIKKTTILILIFNCSYAKSGTYKIASAFLNFAQIPLLFLFFDFTCAFNYIPVRDSK